MITHRNFKLIVDSLSDKDKKRILNSNKEFCVLILHVFNAGYTVNCILTNNYIRYQNAGNQGNAIVPIEEVAEILNQKLKSNEKSI
jgi:hypothetical protein